MFKKVLCYNRLCVDMFLLCVIKMTLCVKKYHPFLNVRNAFPTIFEFKKIHFQFKQCIFIQKNRLLPILRN
jgi:hypothetical protein